MCEVAVCNVLGVGNDDVFFHGVLYFFIWNTNNENSSGVILLPITEVTKKDKNERHRRDTSIALVITNWHSTSNIQHPTSDIL